MTSEGLGEMFKGNSADTCGRQFSLMSMGGRAEGLACANPGARTPIGVSVNFSCLVVRIVSLDLKVLSVIMPTSLTSPVKYIKEDPHKVVLEC